MKVILILTIVGLVSSHAPPVPYLVLNRQPIGSTTQKPFIQPSLSKSTNVRGSLLKESDHVDYVSPPLTVLDNLFYVQTSSPAYSTQYTTPAYNSAYTAKPVLSYIRNNIPKMMKQYYPTTSKSPTQLPSSSLSPSYDNPFNLMSHGTKTGQPPKSYFQSQPAFEHKAKHSYDHNPEYDSKEVYGTKSSQNSKPSYESKSSYHDYQPTFLNKNLYPTQAQTNPYDFSYLIDDGYGNSVNQKETGDDNGTKKGSYGYRDAFGVFRQVNYIADQNGFRATVNTNEPGMTDNHTNTKRLNKLPRDVYPNYNKNTSPSPSNPSYNKKNVNFDSQPLLYVSHPNQSQANRYLGNHDFQPSAFMNHDPRISLSYVQPSLSTKYEDEEEVEADDDDDDEDNDNDKASYKTKFEINNYTLPFNSRPNHHNSYETIPHQSYRYNSGSHQPKLYKVPVNQAGYYNPESNHTSSYKYKPDQFDPYSTRTKPPFKYKQENDESIPLEFRPEQHHFYQSRPNQSNLYNSNLNQENLYNSADDMEDHEGIYSPDSDPVSEYKLDLNQLPVSEESYDPNEKELNGNDYKYRNHLNRTAHYREIEKGPSYENTNSYSKNNYPYESNRPYSYENGEGRPQFNENQYENHSERPGQNYIIRVITSNKPSSLSYPSKSVQANYGRYSQSPTSEGYQPVIISETSLQSDDLKAKVTPSNLLKAYNDAKSKVNFSYSLGYKASPPIDALYHSFSSSEISPSLTRSTATNKTANYSSLTKPRFKTYQHHIVPSIIYAD